MGDYKGCHMYDDNTDAIDKPAKDVFEINDFTAATDWEKFIDDFENIIRGWKLSGARTSAAETVLKRSDFTRRNWRCKSAEMQYLNFPFVVTHYSLDVQRENTPPKTTEEREEESIRDDAEKSERVGTSAVLSDLASCVSDFATDSPLPSYFFGLREFLLISPGGNDILGNETRASQVVGAVNIALNDTYCEIPALIQVMDPRKSLFMGSSVADNTRIEFSTVCLNRKPAYQANLSGLVSIFQNMVCSPLPVDVSPASVSARLSFQLEDWHSYAWSVPPPQLDLYSLSGDTDYIQLKELPFGCVSDPISRLTLHTTWRDLGEELITDNSIHSDLDPLEAPEWSVTIQLDENPECLLFKHLKQLLDLTEDGRTAQHLIGDWLAEQEGQTGHDQQAEKVSNLLDKLAANPMEKHSYSFSGLADKIRPLRNRTPTGGPLRQDLLQHVLGYLFPDCEPGHTPYESTEVVGDTTEERSSTWNPYANQQAKTCPENGLVWRLAVSVACCLGWAGAGGVAHLLHEFCLELRYRWEHGIIIPGLPREAPHTGHNILHQKLQMINCCIERKAAAAAKLSAQAPPSPKSGPAKSKDAVREKDDADSDTDYEEFYECDDGEGDAKDDLSKDRPEEDTEKKVTDPSRPWEVAEGRDERVGDLRLINDRDFLYRPIVQEQPPMTEDQLAEQAEVLMQLGSDQAGSEVRARLQSASLLSDMESFKAANPGCCLADFVRWHSPRDWDETSGLSARMRLPDNMWADFWEQARAVPAHRQKRLFDETREAEKVVQFMNLLAPYDAAQLLLPVLIQAAHLRIIRACEWDVKADPANTEIVKCLENMSKFICLPEVRHYRGNISSHEFVERSRLAGRLVDLIRQEEMKTSRILSLRKKFLYDLSVAENEENEEEDALQEMERFVTTLASGGEVRVSGAALGPAGRLIRSMFKESDQSEHPRPNGLPPPTVKEMILRVVAGRPLPASRPTPHRLYAKFSPNEFRLAGAFVVDRQFL